MATKISEGKEIMVSKEAQKVIDTLNKEIYPLYKVVMEDNYRFRDVDVDYLIGAEAHELLRKGHRSTLYFKEQHGDDWKVLYEDLSADMLEAYMEIEEIKGHYSYWKSIFIDDEPIMFIYANQVFHHPYVMMSQLCISGEPIEPDKYYTEENRVKVNFLKSYVHPVKKNFVLLHADQIYYNGHLMYTREKLKELGLKVYISRDLESFIRKNFPEADGYESEMETCYFSSRNKKGDRDGDQKIQGNL